jgi:hypothetical protein
MMPKGGTLKPTKYKIFKNIKSRYFDFTIYINKASSM